MGRPARNPPEPFQANPTRTSDSDKLPETLWMKRPARTINEMRDAVFLGLGRVFATQFLEPTGRLGRFIEVEEIGIEHLVQAELSKLRDLNPGPRIQPVQDRHPATAVGLADKIHFIQ